MEATWARAARLAADRQRDYFIEAVRARKKPHMDATLNDLDLKMEALFEMIEDKGDRLEQLMREVIEKLRTIERKLDLAAQLLAPSDRPQVLFAPGEKINFWGEEIQQQGGNSP